MEHLKFLIIPENIRNVLEELNRYAELFSRPLDDPSVII